MRKIDHRPLPFTLKVASEWMSARDALGPTDGPLFFQQGMLLTGNITLRNNGRNIEFSDIGLLNDPNTN